MPMTGPFVLSTDDVAGGGCTTIAKGARSAPTYSAPPRGGAARASPSMTMIDDADTSTGPTPGRPSNRFEVRSVTGARYTLVEEAGRDGTGGHARHSYRTAYAGLPVVANDDGSFTIVDTHTRLVPVSAR